MNVKIKKFKPSFKASIAVIIIASLITTGFMFRLSPREPSLFWESVRERPLLFVLNYAPVLLLMLLFYFVSGNCIFSSGIPAIIFLAGSFANSAKSNLRQEPLIPSDLSVITEVKSIIVKYGKIYVNLAIAAIIIVIVLCILAFLFFKKSDSLNFKNQTIGASCCIICFFAMLFGVYSNTDLYDSFSIDGNIYFKVNQYVSKGFLYSFVYDINNLRVTKPAGYNPMEFRRTEAASLDMNNVAKPNIIMIMSEAFSDISNSDSISFEEYEEPLEFYNSLISQEDVVSGHIVVPNFGGGTSDTEFDVLTGYSTKYVESSQVSYNFVRHPIETIPSLLKDLGYNTLAIHPGYSWFYNRINVFENMGFDNFLYLENSFDSETQNKGGYISDEALTNSIIENFEKNIGKGPLFEFCITIQNHGPYEDKYWELEQNFSTEEELSEEEIRMYSGYFQGIKDADRQIETLVDYFENSEEAVVLVFFGDHLPGFSNGMSYFSHFHPDIDLNGDPQQRLMAYETPFFIWANNAAKEITNFDERINTLPENNVISSFYLGALTMELIGMGSISPFFEYVNEMRKILPVASSYFVVYTDGTIAMNINKDELDIINKYKRWIYYKLFDE